ncbi:hypothetical protein [Microbacterium sp. NPDC087665]|uniref:hypothetical protein n=1 Tax=Microbacterium sp. NPDC087665 TaxID=3364194 RepID=UPI0038033409
MSLRARLLIAGGAAIVIVIGAATIWIGQSSAPVSAEDAAAAYLRALESGDSAAVEATGIAVTPEALAAFDEADALIDEAAVTAVEQADATATADVSFTLGGATHDAELSLALTDGSWTVDSSGLGTVSAKTSPGTAISLGAATFTASDDIVLLPAVYAAVAAPADLLDGGADVVVLPGAQTEISVDAVLLPEATTAAQQQLDEHLEECTSSGEVVPDGCGIRIPWGTDFRDVSEVGYRIDALPTIVLSESGFTAADGALVATVSGTGQDGTARTLTYRTDDWSVRGDVTFSDRELMLETW